MQVIFDDYIKLVILLVLITIFENEIKEKNIMMMSYQEGAAYQLKIMSLVMDT